MDRHCSSRTEQLMPIHRVSQPTDRGNIKNLAHPHEINVTYNDPSPISSELRYKKLYEYAATHKDIKLVQALGIITTDYISDKNALPLSIYRIRQTVEDIKSRSGHQIEKLQQQFIGHLKDPVSPKLINYLSKHKRIKTASISKTPFRRVSV